MNYFYIAMSGIGTVSLLAFFWMAGKVKKAVGFDFLNAMHKAKMAAIKNKPVAVLRIRDLAGNESYQTVEVSEYMKYKYQQNGKPVEKAVIYDERAVTIWNGVKVLNVSPVSIFPIDRNTGLYVNINPELTNKVVTDSGKTAETEKGNKEMMKQLFWIAAICIGGTILAISYFSENQSACYETLGRVYETAKTSATIVANS